MDLPAEWLADMTDEDLRDLETQVRLLGVVGAPCGPDEPAVWEMEQTEEDRLVWAAWKRTCQEAERDEEAAARGRRRTRCKNCKMLKTLRTSGRCSACDRWITDHGGEQRPLKVILSDIARRLKKGEEL